MITSELITITIKVKTCPTCFGRGKTEQQEYTPPFESFIGTCKTCSGLGRVQA